MLQNLKDKIESKRNLRSIFWKFLVFLKDFIWSLEKDPFLAMKFFLLSVRMFYYKSIGKKVIICGLSNDYFFHTFESIYNRFREGKKIKVFFLHPGDYGYVKKHLSRYIKQDLVVPRNLSNLLPFDIAISSERHMDYGIFFDKNLRIILMDHGSGIGILNFDKQKQIMERCDIHFSSGPHYSNLIKKMHFNKKYKLYEIGYPKSDKLWNLKNSKFSCFKNIKTILYVPHWKLGSSIHVFQEDIIKALAKTKLKIIVKSHNFLYRRFDYQNWEKKFKALSEKYDNVIYSREVDAQKLFPLTDILVTDTRTTTGFEYSFLLKPLIAFKNPKEKNISFSLFEKEVSNMAFNFGSLNQLSNILNQFKNPSKKFINKIKNQRKKQKELILKYVPNPGKATEKAVKIIERELGL